MADQHIIAGTTVPVAATVKNSAGNPVNVSTGFTVVLKYVRQDDPSATVITKSTALTDDDEVDVAENGATGGVSATLTKDDTAALAPATYKGQWLVRRDSDDVQVVRPADTLIVAASYH